MPELGLFQWIIGGVVAGGLAVAAYLNGRINGVHELARDNELETSKLRSHVSEHYSTKEETRSVESKVQHSLDRIHERIDKIDACLKDMPHAIVSLFGKAGK